MEDFRNESRRKTTGGVLYSYMGGEMPSGAFAGLLSNISATGACIYTQEAIEEGGVISIYGKALDFREPKKASVMWCNRIYDDLYMVGLLFPRN